jgi:hypothetical protein
MAEVEDFERLARAVGRCDQKLVVAVVVPPIHRSFLNVRPCL